MSDLELSDLCVPAVDRARQLAGLELSDLGVSGVVRGWQVDVACRDPVSCSLLDLVHVIPNHKSMVIQSH